MLVSRLSHVKLLLEGCMLDKLTTIGNGLDLATEGGVDELNKVDPGESIDDAEVEVAELQVTEVEVVEDTGLADEQQGVEGLELEEGVDVEDLGVEDVLEEEDVEVVSDMKVLEELQIEGVEALEVAQVNLVEAQVVQAAGVEDGASVEGVGSGVDRGRLSDGGGDGSGGKEAGEDGRELHGDGLFGCWFPCWSERKGRGERP